MAPSANADYIVIVPSTAPPTTPGDLDAPIGFDPSDTNREVTIDTSSSVDYTSYEGID